MTYKLTIKAVIEAYGHTVLEVAAKAGVSMASIQRIENCNDCKFSDLYSLAQAIGCSIEELYKISNDNFEEIKPRRIVKKEKKLQRRADIYSLLSRHIPTELTFLSECLRYDETEIASRLWEERLSPRAIVRINRKAESDSYMNELRAKVNKIKSNLSLCEV